jgi:photosystem II stability/assembly factor-like uncharacterized protein
MKSESSKLKQLKIKRMKSNIILLLICSIISYNSKAQLILRSTVGPTHQAVQFTSDQIGFVLAYAEPNGTFPQGLLRKTVDGGTTWFSLPITFSPTLPVDPTVNTIGVQKILQMIDNNVGFCAGFINSTLSDIPMLLKTTDGGVSWTGLPFTPNVQIESIFFVNANVGYVGVSGKVYKTFDGGATWNIVIDNISPIASFTAIHFVNSTTGFACASGRIYKTIDSGSTWALTSFGTGITTQTMTAVRFMTNDIGFVSTSNGKILKTIDGGETWSTNYTSATNDNLTSISIVNQKIIIGGYNQSGSSSCNTFLLTSIDNGATWAKECFNFPFGTPRYVYSTYFLTETKGFLAVDGGMYEYNTTPLSTSTYLAEQNNLNIYPNPSNGIFNIDKIRQKDNWTIFNNLGELILSGKSEKIDLTNYSDGMYIINVTNSGNNIVSRKLIKK